MSILSVTAVIRSRISLSADAFRAMRYRRLGAEVT